MKPYLDWQCIGIFKSAETLVSADYVFCAGLWVPDENCKGRLRLHQTNFGHIQINKGNGDFKIIRSMPDDIGDRRAFAVGYKLKQHWQQGNLPKATLYASG